MPLGYSFAAGSTRLHSLQNLVDAALARVTVSKNAPAVCSPSFIFGFLLKIFFGVECQVRPNLSTVKIDSATSSKLV